MELTIDFVLQGPIWNQTIGTAEKLLKFEPIKNVIISTWEGDKLITSNNDNIRIIYNKKLKNPGKHNRNRQIFSSFEGIKMCSSDIVVKMRTDQEISQDSLELMYNFFKENYQIDEKFTDGTGPKGAIFTITLYKNFPFHPQDHLFWGFREDMINLFNIPLDSEYPPDDMMDNPTDYGLRSDFNYTDTRPNSYIGMYYYSKFDDKIKEMVLDYKNFIVDKAPNFNIAMEYDKKYINKIFKSFPRLNIFWYKHNRYYPYEWGVGYGEYHS